MTRKQKLLLNSLTSLIYQVVTLICGFVLPRMFLSTYGSEVNGLVSSITQFLGIISLCELGVGAVIQSSLYKPLAEGDRVGISKIAISSERFFRRIAYILVGYTAILMFVYPLKTLGDFDYLYTLFLIFVISISTFAQYYFGMTYRLILSADQLGFIHFIVHSASLILNTVACIILMKLGMSIHVVKLTTSLIFLLQPILVSIIAKRRYKIDRKIILTEEPIQQKWNGLTQHIASVVHTNAPTVILTLFSTFENISVYAVYHLVVNGVKQIVLSLTNGIQAMFGNMLAKNETHELTNSFDVFEWLMHTAVTIIFSLTGALILPFVTVYTNGLNDVNYIVPTFGFALVAAESIYCIRLPYNILVLAAGHYKQTQTSAFIEAGIGIVVSTALVFPLGLVGVAIGTFCSMLYRTIYLTWYLSKNIVYRKMGIFVKHMVVDLLCVGALVATLCFLPNFFKLQTVSYFGWFVLALKTGVVCVLESAIINMIFYWSIAKRSIGIMLRRLQKK